MKYVMLFEQNDWSTDFGKKQSNKFNQKLKNTEKEFKNEFFKLYPKKETKLFFTDKYSSYELELSDIKFIGDTMNIVFKAENGKDILISNPEKIEDKDLQQISLLPVQIKPESQELLQKMFI